MNKRSISRYLKNIHRVGEILTCMRMTPQWLRLTLAYLGLKSLNFPFVFKTRKGQKIHLNTNHDLITIWIIFFRGEYKVPSHQKVIVDAGANIGTFSIYASLFQPKKIIALEPFPETFTALQKNIAANDLGDLIEVQPLALAKDSGTVLMDISAGPSQSRGLVDTNSKNGTSVESLSLKDFFQKMSLEHVDFFKMDIEGSEHEVLKNTDDETFKKINNLALEYHPNQQKKDLFEKILSHGFEILSDFKISDNSGVAHFRKKRT
ncbi:MAG: FkbM family methyltransferase [Bdellovibrionales bacterium]|nr:FkbM family methyltransferase [Bdellovibrionales bacterium]